MSSRYPQKKQQPLLRVVNEMNVAIWQDGYDWLENHGDVGQAYLRATVASIDGGYTPDEIYHQIIREAGLHRIEIAERCRAAANFLRYNEDQ